MAPIIILIHPQLGENIGAAARAAKNFGLTDLRLVAPRDGWPNPKAQEMAAGAADLIERAIVYATTAEAIADCHRVYATTIRERYMNKPVLTPRELFCHPEAKPKDLPPCEILRCAQDNIHTAILFGPERTGLTNEDIALADAILTIPTAPAYPSLNLAQAVALVAYEWFQSTIHSPFEGEPESNQTHPAAKASLHGLFDQLEAALDAVNFWRVEDKKPIMWRNIRSLLQRAQPSEQEVQTLRGMIRALQTRD